jgi:PAS domain S-box-containing protein
MGIFHSLPEGRFLRVNPALAAMCGYDSPEEMVSTITNIPKQLYVDPPRYTELRGLTLKQDEWVHAENRYRRKDGSLMIGNLSLRKVLNPDGTVAYLEGFVEDITVRKRTEEERGRLAEQLRQLACYLQSAREQERAFIAREIHDEFGQALTALKIDLSWLSRRLPKQRADLLDKVNAMSKLVDGTTQTVRRIATELRPGLLDDLGLVAAIEWQAQEFAERTGLACELRLGDKDLALDPDLATTLFRILQEALTNIARHARATRIEVELDDRPDLLTLVVRDNGKGIDPAQVFDSHSLGLMGMRERARVWGGDVVVEGIPGQGTTVIVRIPQTSEVSETSEVGQPQEAQP